MKNLNTIKKLEYTGLIISLFIFGSVVLLVNTVSAQKAETQKLPDLNRDKTSEYFPQNGNNDLFNDVFSKSVRNEKQLPTQNEIRTGSLDGSYKAAKNRNGTIRSKFDFDGDGKTDISIYRPSLGQWWILRSSDNQIQTIQARFEDSTIKLAPADYDGDGLTEVGFVSIYTTESVSPSDTIVIITTTTTITCCPTVVITTTTTIIIVTSAMTIADFDGDDKDDIGSYNPLNSTWSVRRSSDNQTITTQFGLSTDKPVAADYDGDGKADIAIFRPSNGQWWIKRSSDGAVQVVPFGLNGDRPVQADYTGDGKADVAVFRPSTGEWLILRSENNSFYSFPFGNSTDIPVPGDYDADGKSDAAVYRPSNNTWYINRSTGGVQITQFGTTGDVPVPSVYVP